MERLKESLEQGRAAKAGRGEVRAPRKKAAAKEKRTSSRKKRSA
jgi:hypothetical protein